MDSVAWIVVALLVVGIVQLWLLYMLMVEITALLREQAARELEKLAQERYVNERAARMWSHGQTP